MSNTTAYEVINVSGYEVCRGKTKDKRYFFHTTSAKRDSKSISFYADYESERERYICINNSCSMYFNCTCPAEILWTVNFSGWILLKLTFVSAYHVTSSQSDCLKCVSFQCSNCIKHTLPCVKFLNAHLAVRQQQQSGTRTQSSHAKHKNS